MKDKCKAKLFFCFKLVFSLVILPLLPPQGGPDTHQRETVREAAKALFPDTSFKKLPINLSISYLYNNPPIHMVLNNELVKIFDEINHTDCLIF